MSISREIRRMGFRVELLDSRMGNLDGHCCRSEMEHESSQKLPIWLWVDNADYLEWPLLPTQARWDTSEHEVWHPF